MEINNFDKYLEEEFKGVEELSKVTKVDITPVDGPINITITEIELPQDPLSEYIATWMIGKKHKLY